MIQKCIEMCFIRRCCLLALMDVGVDYVPQFSSSTVLADLEKDSVLIVQK